MTPGQTGIDRTFPVPRSPRYESLTLWRGVACLMVVAFHSLCTGHGLALDAGPVARAIFQALWLGVPVFFVISGYCVTASADVLRRQPAPAWNFFRRRFRRIYPPYWIWFAAVAIVVCVVETFIQPGFFAGAFVPNPITLAPAQWLGNLTLTENWRWHIIGGAQSSLLSPSWTLCYEEQFYAIVGIALLLARRFLFAILTAVTALVLVSMVLLPRWNMSLDGLFLDGKWLMFASGVLVYYIVNHARRGTAVWFTIPIILGGMYAASDPRELQGYLTTFAFALLTIGLFRWDRPLAESRWLRPLRYCGEMCYSLYLVHWPTVTIVSWTFNLLGIRNPIVVLGVGLPFCIGAAVAVGRCFHVWIERRFLNASPLRTPAARVDRALNREVVQANS